MRWIVRREKVCMLSQEKSGVRSMLNNIFGVYIWNYTTEIV